MADNQYTDATLTFARAIRESNQAFMRSALAAQERNIRFAQSVFENGIEVLKSHADNTRSLLQKVGEQPQDPQEVFQDVVNSTVTAQERNIRFAQGVFENGLEVLKSHADSTRSLINTVAEQSKDQQEAFWAQPYVETYLNFLNAPFTFYKQTLETAQSITEQAMEVAQTAARQGIDTAQTAVRQSADVAQKAVRQGADAAQSAVHQSADAAQKTTRQAADAAERATRQNKNQ